MCSSDLNDSKDSAAGSTTADTGDTGDTSTVDNGECDYASISTSTDLEQAPEITIPDCDPPAGLEVIDIVEGDGDEVQPDATVTAQYSGVSWSTGEEFDSSWSRGAAATFPLSGVIAGWQQGLPGMRVGGRRLLEIGRAHV